MVVRVKATNLAERVGVEKESRRVSKRSKKHYYGKQCDRIWRNFATLAQVHEHLANF